MEAFALKRSISRKSFYRLSRTQQQRITTEIMRNLQYKKLAHIILKQPNMINDKYRNKKIQNNQNSNNQESCNNNTQETPDSVQAENNSIDLGNNDITNDIDSGSDNTSFSDNDNCSDACSSLVSTSSSVRKSSFRERLASCFVENNISHVQGNSILSVLKTHNCFTSLPKDMRTLLCTPRDKVVTFKVEPGEYLHFDLEASIVRVIKRLPIVSLPSHLDIDFSTDGCSLDRSGNIQMWPIQYKIANIKHMQPIIVGIYKGDAKPQDPNAFFEKFIADVNKILDKGGVIFNNNTIPIRLRCFIADAPARAFILNHRGHMSSNPCSKCKISATKCNGRNIFYDINNTSL